MDRFDDERLENRNGGACSVVAFLCPLPPVPIDSWGKFDTITIDRKSWELWVVFGNRALERESLRMRNGLRS